MTQNLEAALERLRELRADVFNETGRAKTLEQEDDLEAIQTKINEVEEMIKAYGN